MKKNPITIKPDITILDAIHIFLEKKIGLLPVVGDDGLFQGALSLKRVMKLFLPSFFDDAFNLRGIENFGALEYLNEDSRSALTKKVEDVMNRKTITVTTHYSIFSAINIMTQNQLQDLLIVDDGKLVGLVSMVDLGSGFLDNVLNPESIPEDEVEPKE